MGTLYQALLHAREPSRELDCRIAVEIGGFFELPPRFEGDKVGYGYTRDDGTPIHPGHGGYQLVPHYTSSTDDAFRLLDKMYPGWDWILGKTNDGLTIHFNLGNMFEAFGETPALAVVAAIARSKE